MKNMYAFYECDEVPYLKGGIVKEVIRSNSFEKCGRIIEVILEENNLRVKPVVMTSVKNGLKLQKRLDNAEHRFNITCLNAKDKLYSVVNNIKCECDSNEV